MIKTMRNAAHNYPWLLKSVMGLLAVAFVITMGWWGFSDQTGGPVAKVGEQSVSIDEFKRTYENMRRITKKTLRPISKKKSLRNSSWDNS
jgi:peptidyl-prolyl cis-trans isomerase D